MGKVTDIIGKSVLTGGLLYIGAIMPRIFKRPASMSEVYYAHRGLHNNDSDAPENTLAAFAKAVEHEYGIELDVQLSKDGKVVVCHDYNLHRICGIERDVDSMTYEELNQYPIYDSEEMIPLLTDVLELVDGQVPLIIELKVKDIDSKIAEKTDELLQSYAGEYCIESFHPLALIWYRRNHPDVCRGQLAARNVVKGDKKKSFILRHLLLNFLTAPDFIAYDINDKEAISKNICRNLFRCASVAWTIRSEEQLQEAKKYFDYFIFEGFLPEEDN